MVVLSSLWLVACEASYVPTPPPPTTAVLAASPSSIVLVAGSGTPATLTVTNTSSNVTANAVGATLPVGWSDVTQTAAGCATLAPQASCTLTFTPGNVSHSASSVIIGGQYAASTSATLAVNPPATATITAAGTPLSLLAGSGAAGTLTITNQSTVLTATNISADLSGTPLQGAVTQDASGCAHVLPKASCTLSFTPRNTAVTLTHFPIHGGNTGQVGGAIEITLPTSAPISVAGSPLLLQSSYGTEAMGSLSITNHSTVLTATNITAAVTGTALANQLIENSSNCTSVAPGASCTLEFTPSGSAAVATTQVIIQGSNTSQVGAGIAINAASQATLSVAGSPLVLFARGAAGNLTVTNTSSSVIATGITVNLTGTALAGNVTETGTCSAALAPAASCVIALTPGSNSVAATAIAIEAIDAQAVIANVTVLGLGDAYQGGILYQLPGLGTPGMVVSTTDGQATWGTVGVSTGATSSSDGLANTDAIVATFGLGSGFAAPLCASYSLTDSTGTYNSWYLPAINELNAAREAGSRANFSVGYYWSSTEYTATNAWATDMIGGNYYTAYKPTVDFYRCVHSF